jgi:hypothetical protein
MRKNISFTIAAAIMCLAMALWLKAAVVENNADVARPRADLLSPMHPFLSSQALKLVY